MKYRNNGYFIGNHGNNGGLATEKSMITSVYGWPCGYTTYIMPV